MSSIPAGVDPLWYAMSKLRRRKRDETVAICSDLLSANGRDQAAWYVKTRAMTLQQCVDDTEMEEERVGDALLDENAIAGNPRPGTSINRAEVGGAGLSQGIRPVTSAGRPLTGFLRPGTASRPLTGSTDVNAALKSAQPGAPRPSTSLLGRQIRLGTMSMAAGSGDGNFINIDRMDLKKYAKRPVVAMALEDYLLSVEHNPRKALELALEVQRLAEHKGWWWKARLGRSYYKLGLLREAESSFKSSLSEQDMVVTVLELAKVYEKLDLPNTALGSLTRCAEKNPGEVRLLVGLARIHEMLNDARKSSEIYARVMCMDASNVEAISSLAANHFYADQPEISLRYYRRLLQMGLSGPELWNNIGLSCFYANQHDMALGCLVRAVGLAGDDTSADVWYNIGQLAIALGDPNLAHQAFRVAVSVNSSHAESYTNLGVLEARKSKPEAAKIYYKRAQETGPWLFEPFYNGALLAYRIGDFTSAHAQCEKALACYPEHKDSQELMELLLSFFKVII